MASVFETLNNINVNGHTEKKNNLTYLSWAWAWAEVKKAFPTAFYTIYENPDGWNYFTDGRTAWVKTGVTIEGLEHIEYLPVMDFKNKSIPLESITSFDVNKAIQRSLTKAAARHGLGLYIYAGEDLPEAEDESKKKAEELAKQPIGEGKAKILETELKNRGIPVDVVCARVGVKTLAELTEGQHADVATDLDKYEMVMKISSMAKPNQVKWAKEQFGVTDLLDAKVGELKKFLKALEGKFDGSTSAA